MALFEPGYLRLHRNHGELARRAKLARQHLASCDLCARHCHANRLQGNLGACHTGEHALVSSYGAHHGEERPLVGRYGSGTIFFSWCNLHCVFCQNWEISQRGDGREVSGAELAGIMLKLQQQGCHNINLVSPSHVVAQLLEALVIAVEDGLHLPLVYNTGGYDSPEALALLDGVVDIYLPDMKFADSNVALRYLGVRDYAEVNRANIREMHRQVGDLELDDQGIARHGLLVRHLVLPNNLAGSDRVMEFIAREISRNTYLNLMDQYRPCYRAEKYPPLARRTSREEFRCAQEQGGMLGLQRLDSR